MIKCDTYAGLKYLAVWHIRRYSKEASIVTGIIKCTSKPRVMISGNYNHLPQNPALASHEVNFSLLNIQPISITGKRDFISSSN